MPLKSSARDLLFAETETLGPSYTDTVDAISWDGRIWLKPFEEWTQKDMDNAKADAAEAMRSRLPFSKRYDIMVRFNKFIHDYAGGLSYTPILLEKITERAEVEIELLKLTQGGTNPDMNKRNRGKLAGKLHFSQEALKPYLQRLNEENKPNLLGSSVGIRLKHGDNTYDSTIHPVFLALNLSEVNFLVNHLRLQFMGTPYEQIASQISYDVYRQLSQYGKDRMDEVAAVNGIRLGCGPSGRPLKPGYHHESDLKHIPYLAKMSSCIIHPIGRPEERHTGHIEYRGRGYAFIGDDGFTLELDETALGEYEFSHPGNTQMGS